MSESTTRRDDRASGPALVCRARHVLAGLPLAHVIETMRPLPTQALGGAPPYVLGVAVIRGVATPVVDAGALLGSKDAGAPTRFVTVRAGARTIALAFEEVRGIRTLASASFAALPGLLAGDAAAAAHALGTLDAELLVVLESARVLPDAVWQALEAPGAAP